MANETQEADPLYVVVRVSKNRFQIAHRMPITIETESRFVYHFEPRKYSYEMTAFDELDARSQKEATNG